MIELKCPLCQQEAYITEWESANSEAYCPHCDTTGDLKLWQELIRTRKALGQSETCCAEWEKEALDYKAENIALSGDLECTRKALDVAIDALKEQQRWFGVIRVSLISHLNNQYGTLFKSYDADPTVVNIKRANDILNRAIEQITALEQKE